MYKWSIWSRIRSLGFSVEYHQYIRDTFVSNNDEASAGHRLFLALQFQDDPYAKYPVNTLKDGFDTIPRILHETI